MTQNSESTDTSDKKEAAKFFNSWMTTEHKDDQWDEVCLQWCKQQQKARANQTDPNCSMLCLKRHQQDSGGSWNPLNGYAITLFKGKEDCVDHTNEMIKDDTNDEYVWLLKKNLNLKNNSSRKETKTPPIKYEVDLGHVWSETEIKAKQVVNENVIPYYNSAIEQALGWKDSPQGVQFQKTVKDKASTLLGYIYPLSPVKVNKNDEND